MKIRRYKKVHKHLNFYVNNFGFRQPYQLLIDGTFCFAALNNKINVQDNLPRYLQAELKFLTTQCVIIETDNLGPKLAGALIVLKKFPLHKCGHEGKPVSAADCLQSMMGKTNSSHYLIATQDRDLQNKFRQIPGTPLVYLHQKTPVLEHPSEVSIKSAQNTSNSRFVLGKEENEIITELKEKHGILEVEDQPIKKKKRRGPNPLSCKKKQKKAELPTIQRKTETKAESNKKQRKKVRIPQHVKDALFNSTK